MRFHQHAEMPSFFIKFSSLAVPDQYLICISTVKFWHIKDIGNIMFLILMKLTPTAASEIIILTTSGAASEDTPCYQIPQSPENARCGCNGVEWCCSGAYQISARHAFIIKARYAVMKRGFNSSPLSKMATISQATFPWVHFHEWKVLYFDLNFIEVSS